MNLRQVALNGLVASAGAIPVTVLPNGPTMIADLAAALRASNQADQYYIAWMQDIEGLSCPYPTNTEPNFAAASSASAQATSAKTAFVVLWNPLAAQLGLPQYSASQI
jgi:hypothetical protein